MVKKLLSGELGFGRTFWQFGILGMILINIPNVIITKMVLSKLRGVGILEYYSKYFSLAHHDILMVSAFYLLSILLILVYGIIVIIATWRASVDYDKSNSLVALGRFLVVAIVLICLSTNL